MEIVGKHEPIVVRGVGDIRYEIGFDMTGNDITSVFIELYDRHGKLISCWTSARRDGEIGAAIFKEDEAADSIQLAGFEFTKTSLRCGANKAWFFDKLVSDPAEVTNGRT